MKSNISLEAMLKCMAPQEIFNRRTLLALCATLRHLQVSLVSSEWGTWSLQTVVLLHQVLQWEKPHFGMLLMFWPLEKWQMKNFLTIRYIYFVFLMMQRLQTLPDNSGNFQYFLSFFCVKPSPRNAILRGTSVPSSTSWFFGDKLSGISDKTRHLPGE